MRDCFELPCLTRSRARFRQIQPSIIHVLFQDAGDLTDVDGLGHVGSHAVAQAPLNIVGICVRCHGDDGQRSIRPVHDADRTGNR